MDAPLGFELMLLALAWAATLLVKPWRLLRPHGGKVPLATPALALAVVISWLWAWPGLAALPIPLHWSGAPLAALLVGWPLAIPILTVAGLSTMASTGASFADAVGMTVWSGVVPATLVLGMGHVVRTAFGPNPVAYMLGRAFFVPMLALGGCGVIAAALGHGFSGPTGELQRIAIALLAMGEAAWSCAIVSLLVAYRPQWLATWSDTMYLGRRSPARVRAQQPLPRR
jgi:uncharacterized membrane protein